MSDNELRPAARNVIDLARSARTPDERHRERAYQALLAGLGGTAAVGTSKAAAAAAKVASQGSLAWLKWALPTALLAAGGAGAYVWSARQTVAPPPHSSPARQATPPPALATPTAAPSEAPAPSAQPAAEVQPEPSAKPSGPPGKAGAKPSGDALLQEISLLHDALAASRSGNAARALELAREHAQRYPSSRLGLERSAIEVRSLCSLGRVAEARKVAERLRARAPGSPLSSALQDTCVGK